MTPADGPVPQVAIFYYAWYGTPSTDGAWAHWTAGRERAAPDDRVELLPGQGAVLVRYREGRARPDARHCRHGRRHGDRLVVGSRLGRGRAAATGRGRRARRGPARGAPRRAVGGDGRPRASSTRFEGSTGSASATSTSTTRRARRTRNGRPRSRALSGYRVFAHTPLAGEGAARRLPGPLHVRRARLRRTLVRPDVRVARGAWASCARLPSAPASTRPARRAICASATARTGRRTTRCGRRRSVRRRTSSRSRATTSGTRGRRSSRRATSGARYLSYDGA